MQSDTSQKWASVAGETPWNQTDGTSQPPNTATSGPSFDWRPYHQQHQAVVLQSRPLVRDRPQRATARKPATRENRRNGDCFDRSGFENRGGFDSCILTFYETHRAIRSLISGHFSIICIGEFGLACIGKRGKAKNSLDP